MSTSEIPSSKVLPETQTVIASSPDLSSKTPVQKVCEQPAQPKPAYTAISQSRRRFILGIVTVAGIFGPLAGNIYLPALPVMARQFHKTETEINVTVTVFMVVFAFGVSLSSVLP